MNYDPNPDAPPTGARPLPGWTHPLGRPDGPTGGDDGLVHLAGVILAALAVLLLAATAAVAGLAAYGLITWRRTRWWPPVLAGLVAGLLATAALGGPGPALHHHLLAARELAGPHPGGLADLFAMRAAAWLWAQLPLSVPLGLVAAGLARHRVTHLPAHELSPSAQARRTAEDRARLRRARQRAGAAPIEARGQKVLGAWVSGDLAAWRAGEWCTVPDGVLGLGTVVLGLPGAGKTETLLRLAQLALAGGYDVHVIDAKGDPATQQRFAALAAAHGHEAKLFPQESYDGWRGDPTALRNRLGRVVDYTEPYYQDGARVLLAHATRHRPHGLDELLVGMADPDLDVDNQVRKGTVSRYRSFSAAVGTQLSGAWAFEDTRASYILLDGVALGDDTPRLARYLLEDFQHYTAARKPPNRRTLLIVDEFSALRVSNAAALLERLRSFGAGVVIAAQSVEGLHDDAGERARLLGAASTVIAHRLADPEPVAARAGTVKRAERSHQLDQVGATGLGSLRIQETYRVDPNDLRNLGSGVAWIVSGGRAAKTAIARAAVGRAEEGPQTASEPPSPVDPPPDRRAGGPVGPAEPVFGFPSAVTALPEDVAFVEALLVPTTAAQESLADPDLINQRTVVRNPTPAFEQQALARCEPADGRLSSTDSQPEAPTDETAAGPQVEPTPPLCASPYADRLRP